MPIPVTIITGFLWAGKTTLLNHILRGDHGYKIAVIENEFGREGIDAELVEETREELIQISNGCICCVVRWDFLAAVERLLSSGKKIDHIIVEASGMSEPLPVAQSFLMNTFEDRIRLDSIICLIDAENFRTNVVQNTQTATEQLEFADIIVMNKVDLVSEKEKEDTIRFVRTINRQAPIFESSHGKVEIRYLIDTHAFILTEEKEQEMNHHHHTHDSSFSEFLFRSSIPFDMEKLERFISALPIEVFRIKWFCFFEGTDKQFILQRAGKKLTLDTYTKPKSQLENKLIFIGQDLDVGNIQKALNQCLVQSNPLFR